MPGVLVDSPSFPFDMLSSPFELHGAPPFVDDASRPSDLDPRSFGLGVFQQQQHTSMEFCPSPPPSPSDRSSPRFPPDSRDEYGQQKVFVRGLSKLGAAPQSSVLGYGEGDAKMECGGGLGMEAGGLSDIGFFPNEFVGGMSIPFPPQHFSGNNNLSGSSYGSNSSNNSLVGSPVFPDAITALHKFLPSNNDDDEIWPADAWPATDVYSCDDFRMYEFKVRRCMRARSHDWTECPFAHPGEKARRRDPRRIHYSGTACPDFRKGSCKRGDACEYAHGVFECWLHPARYRTQPCKDGKNCKRRVCFFAHTAHQLRLLPAGTSTGTSGGNSPRPSLKPSSYDGSPLRQAMFDDISHMGSSPRSNNHLFASKPGYGGISTYVSSPTSTLVGHSQSPPPLSPPFSPPYSPPMSPDLSRRLAAQCHPGSAFVPAHRRHLDKLQSLPSISIPSLDGRDLDDLGCPLLPNSSPQSMNELLSTLQNLQLKSRVVDANRMPSPHWALQSTAFESYASRSLPCSPSNSKWSSQAALWDCSEAEVEPPARRVESGRDLRAKIYGKIGKENGVENETPDLDWVNDLVK